MSDDNTPVKKPLDNWEQRQIVADELAKKHVEAYLADVADVIRHRLVLEARWIKNSEDDANHRAKVEEQNERLVTSQEKQANALERIATALEKPVTLDVGTREE